MLQEISLLEAIHKDSYQENDYVRLQELYATLNVVYAHKIGQQLLHKKQKIFEYRDKPGKCWAYL